MSFYHMLNGIHTDVEEILAVLDLSPIRISRFRDCGINKKENYIWILTRTGGANRGNYPVEKLIEHPCYLRDHDEPFDNTYAIYYFSIPVNRDVSAFKERSVPDLKKALDQTIHNIEQGKITPSQQDFMNHLAEVFREMK